MNSSASVLTADVAAPIGTTPAPASVPRVGPTRRAFTIAEDGIAIAVLALMTVMPLVETAGRATLGRGLPGAIVLVQQLTLWIALLGAALAARTDRLLALSTAKFLSARVRARVQVFTGAVAAGITAVLFTASLAFTLIERQAGGAGGKVEVSFFTLVTQALLRQGTERHP